MINILGATKLCSTEAIYHIAYPPAIYDYLIFSTSLLILAIVFFLKYYHRHVSSHKVIFHYDSKRTCMSLMTNNIEHFSGISSL